jgi:hypothetical protein
MSYAIEVRKVPVRIHGIRGDAFDADVFLHSARPHDPGVETISDRLNSVEEHFLPCRTDTGVQLVRLEAIAYLESVDPGPELKRLEEVGAAEIRVELCLENGDRLSGDLRCELAVGHRLSDYLNTDESRFVLLIEGSRVLFVNKNVIDRVLQ